MIVLFLGARRAAHLPPGRRRRPTSPNDPRNVRAGSSATSAGRAARSSPPTATIVAESVPTDDELEVSSVSTRRTARCSRTSSATSRSYFGNTGVEADVQRRARRPRRRPRSSTTSADFFSGEDRRGNVVLSLRRRRSSAPRDALGGQRGSVVVLDAKTGAVLADVLEPDVRPEPARGPRHAGGRRRVLRRAERRPDEARRSPRAYRERYPPGSTFKVVTADVGARDRASPLADDRCSRTLSDAPDSRCTEHDARATSAASACGGTLARELRRLVQHDVRARSASTSASSSRRASQRFGVERRPAAARPRPGAVGERRSRAGHVRDERSRGSRSPASARATVAVTPLADGAGRGGGRERRRDHGAARARARSATPTADVVRSDRAEAVDDVRCTPRPRPTVTRR